MKRLLALLLCLALLCSLVPNVFARSLAEPADIWDQIQAVEDRVYKPRETVNVVQAEQAYAAAIEEIIQLVEASDDYVPGSIVRNGDFFFWDEMDGTACGYSPRLRARIRESANPNADPEAYAGIETVSYNTKGGWPNTVNVAAFQPYVGIDSSFSAQYEVRCNSIAQALGGTGTTYKTTDATIDNIANAIQTCAVVIFDSHGDTDYASGYDYTSRANTSYICLQSGAGFTAEDQATVSGPYGNYKHAYYGGGYGSMNYYMADGTAIANHMNGNSPNGLLWMAICLGMATDGLQAPMRAKGVEVVYGYSQSVTFAGDYAWEGKFWPQMINGSNVKDAIAYMKQQVGIKDPYTNSYPAWPIVVSSEDVYPGHGNVDKAQTVHSTWTLFAQYTVNAISNNPEWGTVSVNGTTVTASPKDGYYVDGYEILEGAADVVQNGNVFELNLESDCTIQINFAPRDPALVSFSVPEGVNCDPIEAFVGDWITLPTPAGEPSAEGYTYKFLGWVSAPMDADSLTLPEFLNAGDRVKLSQTQITYYALYSYFVAQDGLEDNQFLRVDEAPASWTGEYVITYDGVYGLGASADYMSSTASNKLGSSKSVVDLAAKGLSYEGNILSGVTDDLVYVVSPTENGSYTVKMKDANQYLAMSTDSDSLTTYSSSNSDKTRWSITMGDKGPIFTNREFTSRSLQYNSGSKLFRCYTGAKQPLTLFAKADGDTWYTTEPKDKTVCEEHQFGDWTVVNEPTCTEAGLRARLCAVCGYKQTETLEPLGHAFGEWTVTVAPTCTEQGEESRVCARCATVETRILEASGHEPAEAVEENEIPATCTEAGSYDKVIYCAKCGEEISRESIELPALGHAYGTPVWTWNEELTEAKATFTCEADDDTQELTAEITSEVTTEPTEEAEGVETITAKVTFQDKEYTDVKTKPIAKLEHDCPCKEFSDMPEYGTVEHAAIDWAFTHEPQITNGTGDGMFHPERTLMRSEAVTFLWRAAGCPAPTSSENPFSDVPNGEWYTDAVLWAVEKGITNGTGGGKFSPEMTLDTGMMLTFLYRQQGKPAFENKLSFSDVPSWYADGVSWAVENKIAAPKSAAVFGSAVPSLRADTVVYLYRVYTGNMLAE